MSSKESIHLGVSSSTNWSVMAQRHASQWQMSNIITMNLQRASFWYLRRVHGRDDGDDNHDDDSNNDDNDNDDDDDTGNARRTEGRRACQTLSIQAS